MAQEIVIVGAGGHAKVIADAIEAQRTFNVAAVCDDAPDRLGSQFGRATIGSLSDVSPSQVPWAVVAIGQNESRRAKTIEVARLGFQLATVVHPSAVISPSASLGPGTVVFAGAVVNADTTVGEGSIINTSASVDHDCTLESFVHIAPGARLAGEVRIESGTLIGMGALILPGRRVAENATVGAGAVVVDAVPPHAIVIGVPARVREHDK